MSKRYNYIYEKLVKSDDDLVGFIAYSIYKKHKIEFIEKIKEDEKRDPSSEDLNAFFIASNTDSQLEKYRTDAEGLLSEIVAITTSEEIKAFEDDMLRSYKETIREMQPSAWKSVLYSVIGAFCFSIILSIFFFIGSFSERNTFEKTMRIINQNRQSSALNDSVRTNPIDIEVIENR